MSDEGEERDKDYENDKKEVGKFQTIEELESQQDQVQESFASVYQIMHQETPRLIVSFSLTGVR